MAVLYVGDVGVKIILEVSVDISASTLRKIKYKRPNGGTGFWNANIETSTQISHITAIGQIDYAGIWTFQAYVETPNWNLSGETVTLSILGALP